MFHSAALLRWLAPLCALLLCSACATSTEPQDIPETNLATPEAAAAKAQALPRPEGLSDEDFPAWLQGERERIAAERHAAQTELSAREAACWRRFFVNACLARARTAQREAMHALLQQELALNAHERAHRAAQVQQRLDEKAKGNEEK